MKLSEKIQEALRQQQEINLSDPAVQKRLATQWGYVPADAQPAPSFADAYQGAMEGVAIWKKRALEAEDLNRKFVAEINGPAYMGEPAQKAVAYLDIGAGGYMDIGTDLTDEQLASLPKGRHMLGIVGTYGVDGYVSAQPAQSVPEDVMRDAERYRYLRARNDDTAGIGCWIEAKGRACDRGWLYGDQLDSAIDTCIEMLAAAPKPESE